MDEIARVIGWWVIAGAAFYVVGKVFFAIDESRAKAQEAIYKIAQHEKRLALRRIYRSTDDESIRNQVKINDGGWSLMMLELDDEQYAAKMRENDESGAFAEALRRVERNGYVMELVGGKIRWRSTEK